MLPDLSILEDLGEQLEGLEMGSWVKVGRDALLVGVVIAAVLFVFFAVQRRYRRGALLIQEGELGDRQPVFSLQAGDDFPVWEIRFFKQRMFSSPFTGK